MLALVLAFAAAADPVPPVPPIAGSTRDIFAPDSEADAKHPLPQNPDRIKETRAAALRRGRAMTTDLFDKFGDAQAADAADVRAFLEAAAVAHAASPVVNEAAWEAARKKLAKVALLSDDPVVRGYFLESQPVDVSEASNRAGEWKGLADRLAADKYPPARRLLALRHQAAELARAGAKEAKAAEDAYWAAYTEAAKGATDDTLVWLLDDAVAAMTAAVKEKKDRAGPHGKAAAALKAAAAPAWAGHLLDGRFHLAHAWDARGTGGTGSIPPAARALFTERLKKAETALTAAHTADPARPGPAGLMVQVCTGLKKDRATMEGWFKRAMEADPDDAAAVWRKADYVSPAWHGSGDELLAFGYQCARTKNVHAGLPLVLFRAHESDRKWADYDKWAEHYGNAVVRDDVRQVLEPHLTAWPEDRHRRTQFFCLCVLWKEAKPAAGHQKRIGLFGTDVSGWTGGWRFGEFKEALDELEREGKDK